MKQTKAIVITTIITLLTLGTVLYSSCKKDHCKTLTCIHGGTCNDGFCSCPSGYTGTYCEIANVTSVGLRNRTFTKVYLTVNAVNYVIDTGATRTFTGNYGDTLRITGYAHGDYGINAGLAAMKLTYPITGTTTQDINVGKDYFFLKVQSYTNVPLITQVHVNFQQRDETLDIVSIPDNGLPYFIGYYKAYTDTHVRLEHTPTTFDFNNLGLTDTMVNQVYTAVITP